MADRGFGDVVADQGIQIGAGQAARMLLGRSIPLPDFYNPNSPNHFQDSEAGQMLHGNGRAWGRFGLRQGGRLAGAALGNMLLPGLGGLLGGWAGGWIGSHIGNSDGKPAPTGTVTVGNINDTGGLGYSIDPNTGNPISGLPNYMPNFTGGDGFSNYGPYAGGYQGLPDTQPDSGPTLPDFSNYGNDLLANWDENGDGHLTPNERRDAAASGALPSQQGGGVGSYDFNGTPFQGTVTNMMANGSQVILGNGDPNGRYRLRGRN